MSFRYTQEWANELLHLYNKQYDNTREEFYRINELLKIAEGTNDVRVVRTLIECLSIEIEGVDETVKNILNTISFQVYYEGLFSSLRLYIKAWGEEFGLYFSSWLDEWYARELTQEELETVVFPLAKKYLTKEDMQNAINNIEESDMLGDSPIDEFYAFFNKELDAKWTPPLQQEEVEPMSEEEMQQNHKEVQKNA
ncbi:hypothetical protein [Halarcobacter sp.]|uniref:hypothetical protein n=1 Tax=Halarcobacter sp. TaxID=2321133 RepID=UPI0029F4A3B1|nr:hypothetical protein [Halarcobacter sp.]